MPTVKNAPWGDAPAGPVQRFTLANDRGNTVHILNYGGVVQSIRIDGKEMVIGFDTLEGYLGKQPNYGAVIGRYANRIGGASFKIDDTTYELVANDGEHQLHGGPEGFNTKIWEAESSTTDTEAVLQLSLLSSDGDMGFPGNLHVICTYEWTNDDALRIHYSATTDKPTVVNLTNHSYFNLGNEATVLGHTLRLDASSYTPVSDSLIPTGDILPVGGTPFDFREEKVVGKDIRADDPQIQLAGGYDHNYVIDEYDGTLREIALVTDPESGRKLRCFTSEPGVQLFTTNFPDGKFSARGGAPLVRHAGICLETQHFPDSPNRANFVSPLLKVGETYNTTTVYRFE
ncbi:aldose 1-epimerase [Lewinella aquimaris]|uniref:Aldose 1-epimerase n=1 Tax=Neolewinella aquimaris TaxID=1835722 RepID=A0A840E5G2_9BACT|nr:aldose epimerase family protein [Neolewinella aquimaris]MBB4080421.1 aldose 1-epimerase [Neolewinella aquimaris]